MNPTSLLPALGRWFVRGLVRFYYPRIEIEGAERLTADGPLLLIANHPNSLIDPVLLGIAARRPVRLLAKAPLFSIPVFGTILRGAGMIPAYRAADDPRAVKRNLDSLAAAARVLADDPTAVLGIFPEGKTHDALHLAALKSGAARLALQAHAAGARDLRVVTVALNYERKERFRSAVWIRVGEPVEVANWLAKHDGEERVAMRALTPELDHRLRRDLIDLDDPAWGGLLDDVEWLLPRQGNRAIAGLVALRERKLVADALNHFHRVAPEHSRTAAARVSAHAESLRAVGLTADARLLREKGHSLALRLARDGLGAWCGGLVAVAGLAIHLLPFAVSRLVAAVLGRGGRATLALWRLLLGGLLLAGWYVLLALAAAAYFQPWVVILLCALTPAAGLFGAQWLRVQRSRSQAWWAELHLLLNRQNAATLRAEHSAIAELLARYAKDWRATSAKVVGDGLPEDRAPEPSTIERSLRLLRPPAWVTGLLATTAAGVIGGAVWWVWHDRPLEWRRTDSPALHDYTAEHLIAELERDERGLVGVVAGIEALNTRFLGFEAGLLSGERSYYNPADDEEIRRMVVSFLALRDATLRLAWTYERHHQLPPSGERARAAELHAAALIFSYDLALRFVVAFEDAESAQRKLNEAEPRWNLPAGTYDTLREALAHREYRRLLERALATNLAGGTSQLGGALTAARARLAIATPSWLATKVVARADTLRGLAGAGFYRASASLSTLVGDARLRAPRQGQSLIAPDQLAVLRSKLRPGDIVIQRRNWYLSNAFLPGYWPHAALYVGSADDIQMLGLANDPRVARHLAAFSLIDNEGHGFALIEAMSEGVVFTSVEHSIGGADGVVVLRPRVDETARREIIARAFDHTGKPYDFDFDFFSADKLVCTEVVYRAVAGRVNLPLVEVLGRRTLPALEIVRYALSPSGEKELEFIALLDGDERKGEAVWSEKDVLAETLERPALTWLQPRR
ncbi:MAG: hypothetical protein EAZ36_07300 [Verrucomicrobia bacterium]|nr:MAG: hypothetical protein EAZ36_07300 [Verrucomicrobiota bacterium]